MRVTVCSDYWLLRSLVSLARVALIRLREAFGDAGTRRGREEE